MRKKARRSRCVTTSLGIGLGLGLSIGLSGQALADSGTNPFASQTLTQGYNLSSAQVPGQTGNSPAQHTLKLAGTGGCGSKCGDGKCGSKKPKPDDGDKS